MDSPVKLIFGTFFFGDMDENEVLHFLNVLNEYHIKELDTARIYVS